MCSCSADSDRSAGERTVRHLFALFLIGLVGAGALVPAIGMAGEDPSELPVDDNELIVGASIGPFMMLERDHPDASTSTLRVGGIVDVFVGLLKRGTSFIDIELAAGPSLIWLGGDGLEQRTPVRTQSRPVLPGASVRADVRGLTSATGNAFTGLLGLALAFYAAPATGTVARISAEIGIGWDVLRDRETHFGLELVYRLPILDDLEDEPGLGVVEPAHLIVLRLAYGF